VQAAFNFGTPNSSLSNARDWQLLFVILIGPASMPVRDSLKISLETADFTTYSPASNSLTLSKNRVKWRTTKLFVTGKDLELQISEKDGVVGFAVRGDQMTSNNQFPLNILCQRISDSWSVSRRLAVLAAFTFH
jgi:hypothetical protein